MTREISKRKFNTKMNVSLAGYWKIINHQKICGIRLGRELPKKEKQKLVCVGIAMLLIALVVITLGCSGKATHLEATPHDAQGWYNKGNKLLRQGQLDEALHCYERALEINPNYTEAWINKGFVLGKQGRTQEQLTCYNRALDINPDNADAWHYKGWVLVRLRRFQEALDCFVKEREIAPSLCSENNIAWLLATCPDDKVRDGERALSISKSLVTRVPSAQHMDTLAVAYATLGRFQDAIQTQEEAIKILKKEGDKRNELNDFHRRLQAYRNGKPWRQP